MLNSLALIFLGGLAAGSLFRRLRLPPLLGMLLFGILIGPSMFHLVDGSVLEISSELRRIALVIILLRAGLALDLSQLKKVGRPALLMCFVPACCEIAATVCFAPMLLQITRLEAAILGAVIAAVSPAVVVPRMLQLMEEKRGTDKSIPQLIMAGASVDDVFVIVLFTSFTGLAQGQSVSVFSFLQIPVSIVCGIAAGILLGGILGKLFAGMNDLRPEAAVLILLSASFALLGLEDALKGILPLSGLLGVMCMGIILLRSHKAKAVMLSQKFSGLWVGAEILLFVLVGTSVDAQYAVKAGFSAVALILIVAVFRMGGVFLCLLKTQLDARERLFCAIAYLPKATVQAAIGGLPLSMGLPCGPIVLTCAVISILVTAPLGAFGVDHTAKRLLKQEK